MRQAVRMVSTKQGTNFKIKLYNHMFREKMDVLMICR